MGLSNIPLWVWSTFFHSCSVDGHLGGFHVLSIANSAAVNIGALKSFAVSFPRIDVQEVGLVDHVVVLVSVLLSLVVVVGFLFFFFPCFCSVG